MLWGIQNQLRIFFLRGRLGQLVPQHDVVHIAGQIKEKLIFFF
jgi:hypothetical protein